MRAAVREIKEAKRKLFRESRACVCALFFDPTARGISTSKRLLYPNRMKKKVSVSVWVPSSSSVRVGPTNKREEEGERG